MTLHTDRLAFLDYAKGIAIVLVVAGHYSPGSSPAVWHLLRDFFYGFHMPVFFFVSGFLFFRELQKQNQFNVVVKKKLLRLGLPFISITSLFCFVL